MKTVKSVPVYREKCLSCNREIEAYTEKRLKSLMDQHKRLKHGVAR